MVFWDIANAFGSLSHNLRWEALRFLNNLVRTYEMPWEDKVHEAYSVKAESLLSWWRWSRTVCEFGLKGFAVKPVGFSIIPVYFIWMCAINHQVNHILILLSLAVKLICYLIVGFFFYSTQ